MRRVVAEGWGAIKTKGWNNVGEVLRWLDSFAAKAGDAGVKLRADFNSCLEPHQFRNFMEWMSPRVRARLDFVEDPFPYDPESGGYAATLCGGSGSGQSSARCG